MVEWEALSPGRRGESHGDREWEAPEEVKNGQKNPGHIVREI